MSQKIPCDGHCGNSYWKKDLIYGPDPYQHEIFDDETPVWLCGDCHHDHYLDI
ncbi:hypothetical protein [Streptomyces sp. NPDC058252]|uniref:hypothetical protein n=1 Tax=Streptomyces sp. NPDC058252 TaxID=3346405 RepID=UPI0036EADB49